MGCCVSTPKPATATAGAPKKHSIPPSSLHPVSKSPPRAEEEAVKEVLTETPHVLLPSIRPDNPDPTPNPNPYYYTPIPKINHGAAANGFPMAILASNSHQIRHRSASPRKRPPSLHHHADEIAALSPLPRPLSPPSPTAAAVTPDEISEVSEISCLSECVSTATAADADGEVRQRVPRSPSPGRIHKGGAFSGDPAFRRERLTGKSPVRRSDPSPRRTGPGRDSGHIVVRSRASGPGVGDGQRRREPGENSGRRSRSPVTRNEAVVSRTNVGRSPSARKNGVSPGRVRAGHQGTGPGGGKKAEDGGFVGGGEESWEANPTAPSESLENPLVSLECFIFL